MKTSLVLLALILLAPHGELEEQIGDLDRRIAAEPDRLELRLRRGELLRLHGSGFKALLDFDYVLARDPGRSELHFFKSLTLRDLQRFDAARRELDRFLRKNPKHPEGLRHSARLHADEGDRSAEAEDWARLFASEARVSPDDALAWLAASDAAHTEQKAADRAALRVLAGACERLGAAVVLELEAAKREARLGHWSAFDHRFDELFARADRKDWLESLKSRLCREYDRP